VRFQSGAKYASHLAGPGAAIVNEALVRQYFPNEDPLGIAITNIGANQNDGDPERWQIVGVVGDVHHSTLNTPARPEIYLPYQQNSWGWGQFFVRTTNDAAALTRSFTGAVRTGDRTVPVANPTHSTRRNTLGLDCLAQPQGLTPLWSGILGALVTTWVAFPPNFIGCPNPRGCSG
jgi:hypothetical protein